MLVTLAAICMKLHCWPDYIIDFYLFDLYLLCHTSFLKEQHVLGMSWQYELCYVLFDLSLLFFYRQKDLQHFPGRSETQLNGSGQKSRNIQCGVVDFSLILLSLFTFAIFTSMIWGITHLIESVVIDLIRSLRHTPADMKI